MGLDGIDESSDLDKFGFVSKIEDFSPDLLARIAKVKLVSMKQAARTAVARVNKLAVPRILTKPEPLPPPPIPRPPPSLFCSSTTTTKATAINKWITRSTVLN